MRKKTAARPAPVLDTPAPAPVIHPALNALAQSRWIYVLVSILLLAPCFWQSHIQAGDLSSHIYNSWLAQLIESNSVPGLAVVGQTTNVLFDLMLSGLFRLLGAEAAQRIAVSLAVLVLAWGAFAFCSAVSGRRPWLIMPSIAMLAYGWVYHVGFFNYYLSLGLCFWVLALVWNATARRVALAIPLVLIAYLAHALPVIWTCCLVGFLFLTRRISPRLTAYVVAGSMLAMVVLHLALQRKTTTVWSAGQFVSIFGVDQMWVYDSKYYFVMAGIFLVWGQLFLTLLRQRGARQVVSSSIFQFCLIVAAGVILLPTVIVIPGFNNSLGYIADRTSLLVGVCICAMLASAAPRRFGQYASVFLALIYFGFLYTDERMLNSFEDRVGLAVRALPPGQRVVSAIHVEDLRIDALAHVIDRACIGHCYSYANYEPSTAQFRVRTFAPNPYVAYTYKDSFLLQVGAYQVLERDLPLYAVDLDANGRMIVKSLPAGAPSGNTTRNSLGDL